MQITMLAGGVGGAIFLEGLRHELKNRKNNPDPNLREAHISVIVNTADDITLHGLRICPDLDTIMYRLGGGINSEQGWGRADETNAVAAELAAYGEGPDWFSLGDKDIATHLIRTRLLALGYPLHQVTQALCARWGIGAEARIAILPMSDDSVETHIVVLDRELGAENLAEDGNSQAAHAAAESTRAIHFQEWWVRYRASIAPQRILAVGAEDATPAPGVIEAIRDADVILLPPSNPVVSIGMILAVPGIREALRTTAAPVVGVSPIIRGAPVRGMADACLKAIGVETSAAAVADLYADFLDGWVVDTADAGLELAASAARTVARDLYMRDVESTAEIAAAALRLAQDIAANGRQR